MQTVTTSDGRKWSAKSVELMKSELDSVLKQRDSVQLQLDLLRGKIHLLDLEQRA